MSNTLNICRNCPVMQIRRLSEGAICSGNNAGSPECITSLENLLDEKYIKPSIYETLLVEQQLGKIVSIGAENE
ncbi:hypothetical protein IPO96_04605 [Candidatus Saccharibacteria bacterium]|nr:MAG: hypothetical protein IPO96_04605 [Candidatus Saccharibacteria bacterium]